MQTVKLRIKTTVYVGDSEIVRPDTAQPVYGDRILQITFKHGRKSVSREFRMEATGLKIIPNTTKYHTS